METKKNYNHNHNNNNKWKEKSHKNKYYEEIVPIHCFECYFTQNPKIYDRLIFSNN